MGHITEEHAFFLGAFDFELFTREPGWATIQAAFDLVRHDNRRPLYVRGKGLFPFTAVFETSTGAIWIAYDAVWLPDLYFADVTARIQLIWEY